MRSMQRDNATALAALSLAALSFGFFLAARATSTLNPVAELPAFLADVTARPGFAAVWTWGQMALGLVALLTYVRLHTTFGRDGQASATLGATTGIVWAAGLLFVTPIQFVAFSILAPDAIGSADAGARAAALALERGLLWIVVTQVTVVFVLRALSVAAFSLVFLGREGRGPRALGWLGILFAVEHLAAALLHQVDQVGGATSALGAIGGILFAVWLLGIAVILLRSPSVASAPAPASAAAQA